MPLLVIGFLLVDRLGEAPRTVEYALTDAAGPVAGVRVAAGAVVATTDANGAVRLDADLVGTAPVTFERDGYYPVVATAVASGGAPVAVGLRSSSINGTVLDAASGQPLAGVAVGVAGGLTVETDADGRYAIAGLPADGTLAFSADGYTAASEAVGNRSSVDVALTYSRVSGTVTDGAGQPVGNVLVQGGEATTVSHGDGTFALDDAAGVTEVRFSASGFDNRAVPVDSSRVVSAQLERITIRATYVNQSGLNDPDQIDRMIQVIDSTELNAIVLDIKLDTIYFDTQVAFFNDVPDMVIPVYDPVAVVKRFHDAGIYTIARLVVFQDPLVARHYPEYAVRNENTGEPWLDPNGVSWVNAFNEPLWDANIALALEAIGKGFDEIQYDYVRFPSDGDLTTADFGPDYSQEAREGAITGFVQKSADAIRPTGAKLALDVFGIIALYDDDQGIGQRLRELAPIADYLCLMVYPSHFAEGNIRSAPGMPNDYPAETITESLERAAEIVPDAADKFRPWLQDFTQPLDGYSEYGPAEVREQIDAAEAFGGNGWMLWNPNNEPSVDALKPAG